MYINLNILIQYNIIENTIQYKKVKLKISSYHIDSSNRKHSYSHYNQANK